MIYEIAEKIGEMVCLCLTVGPEDADRDVLLNGFDCHCAESWNPTTQQNDCCFGIAWGDNEVDLCCGTIITPTVIGHTGSEGPCQGPTFARFNIEFRTCSLTIDPEGGNINDTAPLNSYTEFMAAITERFISCFSCIKYIEITPGHFLKVTEHALFSPNAIGVTFGFEVELG